MAASTRHSSSVIMPPVMLSVRDAEAISSTASHANRASVDCMPKSTVAFLASAMAASNPTVGGPAFISGDVNLTLRNSSAMALMASRDGCCFFMTASNAEIFSLYSSHHAETASPSSPTSHSTSAGGSVATLLSAASTSSTASHAKRASGDDAPCSLLSLKASWIMADVSGRVAADKAVAARMADGDAIGEKASEAATKKAAEMMAEAENFILLEFCFCLLCCVYFFE
mmetsp:Transcript_1691/g.4151  ORF Transcript_1691/g.4151 Transcript_1691/m.4151 type:complete len:228 (-) Transcript_1691:93-776(-)